MAGLVSSKEVADFHKNADKDGSAKALHHTLGYGPNQAAPGNHSHDGGTSIALDVLGSDPLGLIDYVEGPAVQVDCGAAYTNILTLVVPLVAGRVYRITARGSGAQTTTGPGYARLQVTNSGITSFGFLALRTDLPLNSTLVGTAVIVVTAAVTGNETFILRGTTTVSVLRMPVGICMLLVEDMGT